MLGHINLISLVATPVVFYIASAAVMIFVSHYKTADSNS